MPDSLPVTSPVATGGAGTFYERRVGGSLLAVLLVRGTPAFLERCALRRVSFQTRRLGYATDDILLLADDADGERRAVVQCKTSLAAAQSDEDFVETIQNAWIDFSNPAQFTRNRDVLGLVTSKASAKLLEGLTALFHTALGASDESDLDQRLSLRGFVDQNAKKFRDVIVAILTSHLGQAPPARDVFAFLRSWRFIPFDVGVPGSAVETLTQTMLAVANGGNEAARVAEETWRLLLETSEQGMTSGGDFERSTLPARILELHRPTAFTRQEAALAELARLTSATRRTIMATTAGVHIARAKLEQAAIDLLEKNRIVIVTGEAGSGKSVVADKVLSSASKQGVTVALRAGLIGSAQTSDRLLDELVPIQSPKLVLIESAERVFEKPEEERLALTTLIAFVKAQEDWRLLITCRDRYVQTVTAAFLDQVGLPVGVLQVSNFDDAELAEVAERVPGLRVPLADVRARQLLRNPFVLNKAAQLDWGEGVAIPTENRGFRAKIWKELVRKESEIADGMPSRRDATFVSVCVQRAKALAPFTSTSGLDLPAASVLKRDDLLVEAPTDPEMIAPSHDLLEDWGLSHWLSRTFADAQSSWPTFFERIGLHPAIRRVFRMWVAEEAMSGSLTWPTLLALVTDAHCAPHWRDDALAAVLSSPGAAGFLTAAQQHFRSNQTLLTRAIHLTRVVCKEPSPMFRGDPRMAVHALQPVGEAWPAVAEALRIAPLGPGGYFLELGFIRDWMRSVSRDVPEPAGADAIGAIAERLLTAVEQRDQWDRRGDAHAVLKVLCALPRITRPIIERLLEQLRQESGWPRSGVLKAFAETASDISEGHWLAMGEPELAIEICDYLFNVAARRQERERDRQWGRGRLDLDDAFDLAGIGFLNGFPPSAYQGPFFNIIRYGGAGGVSSVLRFVERCCNSYLSVAAEEFGSEVSEYQISLGDGTQVVQRGDVRLWAQYRSLIPGHYMVQSALMALERWLLITATEPVLLDILRSSTTVAPTAVVASVVASNPAAFPVAGLALLRVRDFLSWDHDRFLRDSMDYEGMLENALGTSDHALFRHERAEARKQTHRKVSLADVARILQAGPQREHVQRILDEHIAQIPRNPSERTEEDVVELARLLRMDLRQFDPIRQLDDGRVLLQARPLPDEVQQVLDAAQTDATERLSGLRVDRWVATAWENAASGADWRVHLDAVMATFPTPPDLPTEVDEAAPLWVSPFSHVRNALYVASVCVRDHWIELSPTDKAWCSELIGHVLAARLTLGEHRFAPDEEAIKAACFVCPRLVVEAVSHEAGDRMTTLVARFVLELGSTANFAVCAGVHRYMWATRKSFVLSCTQAVIAFADGERSAHAAHPRTFQDDNTEALEAAIQTVRASVTAQLVSGADSEAQFDLAAIDYRNWGCRDAVQPIAELLGLTDEEPAPSFYERLATLIARSWELGRKWNNRTDEATFDDTYTKTNWIAYYTIHQDPQVAQRVARPLLEATTRHPSEVATFVEQLTTQEDRHKTGRAYWTLWQNGADATIAAAQANSRFEEHSLFRALFLNSHWKDSVWEWPPLRGNYQRVVQLFERLPITADSLSTFSWFLYKLGSAALPEALVVVERKITELPILLAEGRAQSSLESVLARLVYGGTLDVRRQPSLGNSILRLLDHMVDAGSSAAFRMRDEFLTPLHEGSAG